MMKRLVIITLYIWCVVCHLCAQEIPTIERNRFDVSTKDVNFSANGGSKTLKITADNSWTVKSYPASWVHLSQKQNTLVLTVGENPSSTLRKGFITIASGSKNIQIRITQSAVLSNSESTTSADSESTPSSTRFSISSTSANFTAEGGTQTFKINSTNTWNIAAFTDWWGHLTKKGNTLTLKVDANQTSASRNDHFIIKSGERSIRVNISQAAAPTKFEISSTSVSFSPNGGAEDLIITSTESWRIEKKPQSWGHLTIDGNTLTLKADANPQTFARSDYFTLKAGTKEISVRVEQAAGAPTLWVNGKNYSTTVNVGEYAGKTDIPVSTNAENYDIQNVPGWCYITGKAQNGFTLEFFPNNSSYPRYGQIKIKTSAKEVCINVSQSANYRKRKRRENGGWVNMALGFEGGYSVCGDKSWFLNGNVGVRFGNYRDVVQLELGATPGVLMPDELWADEDFSAFYLPLYASAKLSTKNGKFYLKMGGAYNQIVKNDYMGNYSLRAGFGSAWKHFEWDWASIQYNSQDHNNNDYYSSRLHRIPEWMFGMRMAWYITR